MRALVIGPRRVAARAAALASFVALVGVLVGCGSDAPSASTTTGPGEATVPRSTASSPFTAGAPPEGFTVVAAGLGTRAQEWGSDTVGTDAPSTVVRRTDGAADDLVVLTATSTIDLYGPAGRPADGSGGPEGEGITELVVDGRQAFLFDEQEQGDGPGRTARPPVLSVLWGGDLVLELEGEATPEELTTLAEATEVPSDQAAAPTIDDVPDGFELVGRSSAEVVLALGAWVDVGANRVPGGVAAHSIGWVDDPTDPTTAVFALTLPGRGNDLDAVAVVAARHGWGTVEAEEVAGHRALRLERSEDDGTGARHVVRRIVVAETAWGDLLVVGTTDGAAPLGGDLVPFDQLVAVAAGVAPTDDATWEATVQEARGGPGLHPDPGRTELARGMAGDVPWLLQTGAPGPDPYANQDEDGSVRPDRCLKVEAGERPCPRESFGTDDSEVRHYGIDRHPITVVIWNREAAAFRVTPVDGEAFDVAAVAVPGGQVWVAAVDRDLATPSCAPTRPGQHRVEALDAAGAVIGCVNGL